MNELIAFRIVDSTPLSAPITIFTSDEINGPIKGIVFSTASTCDSIALMITPAIGERSMNNENGYTSRSTSQFVPTLCTEMPKSAETLTEKGKLIGTVILGHVMHT